MMKRIIALLILSAMVLACIPAMATTAVYATTQAFMDAMDAKGFSYTYDGISGSYEHERVTTTFNMDNMGTAEVVCSFNKNQNRVELFIYNVVTFDASKETAVIAACNDANLNYRWGKFVCDTDNTVYSESDCNITAENVGEVAIPMLQLLLRVTDHVYPDLEAATR